MPDEDSDIFGSGILVLKIIHVEVKILMVEPVLYMLLDQVAEEFQVDHVAGLGIDRPGHFNGKVIVMSVIILVVAFAEYPFVLSIIPVRIMQAVGGVEMRFAACSDDLGSIF